jgi:hypothetical protein
MTRNFFKLHTFSHFEFFFGSQLTKFSQGKREEKKLREGRQEGI